MCSTPPAMATSQAPRAISDAAVVTAVRPPAHIRSMEKPLQLSDSPASSAVVRPSVSPWSPSWVVAPQTFSSTISGFTSGLRRSSSRMTFTTMSSARVSQKKPFSPALPNAVRTPSTTTTSLTFMRTPVWLLAVGSQLLAPGCWLLVESTSPLTLHFSPYHPPATPERSHAREAPGLTCRYS